MMAGFGPNNRLVNTMQNPDFSVIDMKTNEKFYLYKREGKYYLNRNGVDRYLNTLEQDLCAGLIVFTANGTKYMVVQRHTLPPMHNKENKMTEEHKGLPVLGYLPQSAEKVAMANVNKELEERCLRRIDWFEKENEEAYNAFLAGLKNDVSTLLPTFKPPYDPEFLENARTELLSSFMWFNRAIFQPSRVPLPEDAKE